MARHRRALRSKPSLIIPKKCAIVQNREYLRRLYTAAVKRKANEVRNMLEYASPEQIEALCESSRNFLRGTFPRLNKRLIRSLIPAKNLIRKLACGKTGYETKRRLLIKSLKRDHQKGSGRVQRGGVLPLIPLLAPILSSVLGSTVGALLSK